MKIQPKIVLGCVVGIGIIIASCTNYPKQQITIGISSENLILEDSISQLTKLATGGTPEIMTKGSVSLTKLACEGQLDAIAIADEMWASILCPDANWVNNSDTLYRTRIQLAVPTKKAQELGWNDRTVSRKEVLEALKSGKLKLATTLPTHSNSGYNFLLWLTREELGGNIDPQQITPQTLKPLQPIYQNLAQSSESTSFLAEKLTQNWEDNTIAALYRFLYSPDGKSLSIHGDRVSLPQSVTLVDVNPAVTVTPSWFVTSSDPEIREQLQVEVFEALEESDRSTFEQIAQLNPPLSQEIKRETTPGVAVHRKLLESFHPSIRQKRWIVGIIDGSGSMEGEGFNQLLSAFRELLETEKAKSNFLYSPEDKFSLIVYQGEGAYSLPRNVEASTNLDREKLWQSLNQEVRVGGGTPVKAGLYRGFESALKVPIDYQIEIFLFTDGRFGNPLDRELLSLHQELENKNAQITIVGAGNVNAKQLQKLARELNARPIISSSASQTKEELLKAFREGQI
ncbi:conserved hypothetical protein [Hyella patelloides LEGE 07179]|uniref:VWFA domain-containing protein n=1 Tax=Hyella patelloides LEGE 07179 TaxID=945734 RepID=A0A563W2M0_9CYAN|nr:VWA domain-containing protein [Hyella patelloides]VEP17900.1 conserved hypothetical protein [Hyella patelloides LEGE 07179]